MQIRAPALGGPIRDADEEKKGQLTKSKSFLMGGEKVFLPRKRKTDGEWTEE